MTRSKRKLKSESRIKEVNYNLDPEAMIQTFDLKKYYNITEGIEVKALDGVSINIKKGEFVSVMGPSGSGKTTLLNMIGALDNPTSGEVYISGENIAHMNDNERTNLRLRKIGFIFQFYNLVPVLTAFENVELPMLFAERSQREIDNNVNKFLDLVGLKDRKDFLPSELSGGEQQRVAVARALSNEPAILIADEPTGELDTKMGMEIVQLLRDLNKELNQTILMVTHDPAVGALAERTLRMRDGKIIGTKELLDLRGKEKERLQKEREILDRQINIIKKTVLNLGIKFTKLQIGEISEECEVKDDTLIIETIKNMISNKEIYGQYFESTKSVAFDQQANIDEIDELMKQFEKWEKESSHKKL